MLTYGASMGWPAWAGSWAGLLGWFGCGVVLGGGGLGSLWVLVWGFVLDRWVSGCMGGGDVGEGCVIVWGCVWVGGGVGGGMCVVGCGWLGGIGWVCMVVCDWLCVIA